MKNKYPGKCHACGRQVKRGEGTLERAARTRINKKFQNKKETKENG